MHSSVPYIQLDDRNETVKKRERVNNLRLSLCGAFAVNHIVWQLPKGFIFFSLENLCNILRTKTLGEKIEVNGCSYVCNFVHSNCSASFGQLVSLGFW